jgi:hypothetical protein
MHKDFLYVLNLYKIKNNLLSGDACIASGNTEYLTVIPVILELNPQYSVDAFNNLIWHETCEN